MLVADPATHAIILSGATNDNATLVATHPGGTGAFLEGFTVTFIEPALLAEFGLTGVDPRGSLGLTFGQDSLSGKDLTAVEGGGTITLTATAVPEARFYAGLGLGALGLLAGIRRRYRRQAA